MCAHPELADKCPWKELQDDDWTILLPKQPRFADKCPWDQLIGKAWSHLLEVCPRYIDKLNLETAHLAPWDLTRLFGNDWEIIVDNHRRFKTPPPK